MERQETAWQGNYQHTGKLVAMELAKHNIDITVLSETCFMRLEV